MKQVVLVTLAAAALGGSVLVLGAAAAPGDQPPPAAAMGEAGGFMLDAHLAGMKAALKLTPDQEKNWAAFESAVRDAAQARREAVKEMRQAWRSDDRPSPIERMTATADRLAKASTEIKAIAEAAKPLYESLDGGQQRHFGPLMATLIERHRPMMDHGEMGQRGGWQRDHRPGDVTPD